MNTNVTMITPDTGAIMLGSFTIRADAPGDIVAIFRDLSRRETEARAHRSAVRLAHEANPVPHYRAEVIARTRAHALRHIDRAEERGLAIPETTATEDAFLAALDALAEAGTESDREAASEAAQEALRDWKQAVEDHASQSNAAMLQCHELDNGDIGSLLDCIDTLDHLASVAAYRSQQEILTALAAALFECPRDPAETVQ